MLLHTKAHRGRDCNMLPMHAHSFCLHNGSMPLLSAADSIECLKSRLVAVACLPHNAYKKHKLYDCTRSHAVADSIEYLKNVLLRLYETGEADSLLPVVAQVGTFSATNRLWGRGAGLLTDPARVF